MFPFASATNPCGPESSIFSAYSLNVPLAGSNRPSLFCNCSVNHKDPSGATAGSCGCAPLVGTSHSLIVTLSSATAGGGALPGRAAKACATPRVSETPVAKIIPKPKTNPTSIVIARLLIATSPKRLRVAQGFLPALLRLTLDLPKNTPGGCPSEILCFRFSLRQRGQQHAGAIP